MSDEDIKVNKQNLYVGAGLVGLIVVGVVAATTWVVSINTRLELISMQLTKLVTDIEAQTNEQFMNSQFTNWVYQLAEKNEDLWVPDPDPNKFRNRVKVENGNE